MQAKLIKETDKAFVVNAGGKEITMAKTPGNAKLLAQLKKGGERQGKDVFAGKTVPGEPKVPGKNTPANDTVTADVKGGGKIKVAPGEGIIPLEAMKSEDSAIAFVKQMFAHQNAGGLEMYSGGEVPKTPAEQAAESMRKSFKFGKKFAEGGIVEGEDEDEEEPDTIVAQAVPMANKGGRVTKDGVECYQDGGFVGGAPPPIEEEEDALAPEIPGAAPIPTEMIPAQPAMGGGASGSWAPTVNPNDAVQTGANPADLAGVNAVAPTVTSKPSRIGTFSSTETEIRDTSKAAKDEWAAGAKEAEDAARDMYRANKEELNARTNMLVDFNRQMDQKNKEFQQNEQNRIQAIKDKSQEVEKIENEALNARVDQGALWSEGGGSRVMAALGLMVGGFGQAFNGQQNPAMKIIDTAIDRNIEVQKANIAQKNASAQMKNNQFQRFKSVLGDEKAAEEALRATLYKDVERKMELISARSAGGKNDAALAKDLAEIRMRRGDSLAKVQGTITKISEQDKELKGNPLSDEKDKELSSTAQIVRDLKKMKEIKKLVNTGIAANKINEVAQMLNLGEVKNSAELRTRAGVLYGQIAKNLFGALQGDERTRADKMLPNFSSDDGVFNAQTDTLVDIYEDKYNNLHKRYSQHFSVPNEDLGPARTAKRGFKPYAPAKE